MTITNGGDYIFSPRLLQIRTVMGYQQDIKSVRHVYILHRINSNQVSASISFRNRNWRVRTLFKSGLLAAPLSPEP